MQLLTQDLPSGYNYGFTSIKLTPMNFAQILEYMENVPNDEVEKLYFDYCTVKNDDPNIDNLLFSDFEYIVFFKKGLTISKNLEFTTESKCPDCGSMLSVNFKLSDIKFNKYNADTLDGLRVKFSDNVFTFRMPTVKQFMEVFSKYRFYRKVTDLRIIKLISLFKETEMYHQKVENLVVNATYDDVALLVMLESLYFRTVEPINATCEDCKKKYSRLRDIKVEELKSTLPEEGNPMREVILSDVKELESFKYGGVAIEISSLIANIFRDLIKNSGSIDSKILPREVRKDE